MTTYFFVFFLLTRSIFPACLATDTAFSKEALEEAACTKNSPSRPLWPLPLEIWHKILEPFKPTFLDHPGFLINTHGGYAENLKDLRALCMTCHFFRDALSSMQRWVKKRLQQKTHLYVGSDNAAQLSFHDDTTLFYTLHCQQVDTLETLLIQKSSLTHLPDLRMCQNLKRLIIKDVAPPFSLEQLQTSKPLTLEIFPLEHDQQDWENALLPFSQNPHVLSIRYVKNNDVCLYINKGVTFKDPPHGNVDAS